MSTPIPPLMPPRFSSQHHHYQVVLKYGEEGKASIEAVNPNLKTWVPTKATSIVWLASSFRVGRMVFRRTLRNYMIPMAQFILKRRIF